MIGIEVEALRFASFAKDEFVDLSIEKAQCSHLFLNIYCFSYGSVSQCVIKMK
jgi:hypothetical protein